MPPAVKPETRAAWLGLCTRLLNDGHSPDEVAAASGYADAVTFLRVYRGSLNGPTSSKVEALRTWVENGRKHLPGDDSPKGDHPPTEVAAPIPPVAPQQTLALGSCMVGNLNDLRDVLREVIAFLDHKAKHATTPFERVGYFGASQKARELAATFALGSAQALADTVRRQG